MDKFKGKEITGEFIGEVGSLGYQPFIKYNLVIRTLSNGRIQIRDNDRDNGTCTYSNIIKFLDNWSNILTLNIKHTKKEYVSNDITDGKQCSECDVLFEKPHWKEVLCNDCYNTQLKNGIVPNLPRATNVEL